MGGGDYSFSSRTARAHDSGYYTKSTHEIFTQRNINSAMSPYGVKIREARDSDEHPESFPIIIALDVTGSMGSIPHFLVKDGLPMIMDKIIKGGIKDPQVLFLAIGDHTCDKAPLQVGQFESSDELLDKWLTDVYLEGGGGGNDGESYQLAWYFAGHHTETDSFVKRNKKGVLFTIGDEPVLKEISKRHITEIMGDGQYDDFKTPVLLDKARQYYDCFHLHIMETASGGRKYVQDGWRQLMSDDLILVDRKDQVAGIIAEYVIECYSKTSTDSKSQTSKQYTEPENTPEKEEEEIL